jgi:hypothetical protein
MVNLRVTGTDTTIRRLLRRTLVLLEHYSKKKQKNFLICFETKDLVIHLEYN